MLVLSIKYTQFFFCLIESQSEQYLFNKSKHTLEHTASEQGGAERTAEKKTFFPHFEAIDKRFVRRLRDRFWGRNLIGKGF